VIEDGNTVCLREVEHFKGSGKPPTRNNADKVHADILVHQAVFVWPN